MGQHIRKRTCKHCKGCFDPDPRNVGRQHYCSQPLCRQASKAASQRRWLKAREDQWKSGEDGDGDADNETLKSLLVREIKDRSTSLVRSDGRKMLPPLVENIDAERHEFARYTGGPFAGFETECFSMNSDMSIRIR